jgi:hypothetical protein
MLAKLGTYENGYEDGQKGVGGPIFDNDEYLMGYKDGEGDRIYA